MKWWGFWGDLQWKIKWVSLWFVVLFYSLLRFSSWFEQILSLDNELSVVIKQTLIANIVLYLSMAAPEPSAGVLWGRAIMATSVARGGHVRCLINVWIVASPRQSTRNSEPISFIIHSSGTCNHWLCLQHTKSQSDRDKLTLDWV